MKMKLNGFAANADMFTKEIKHWKTALFAIILKLISKEKPAITRLSHLFR